MLNRFDRHRRLRGHGALRDMLRETRLRRDDLIWPLFVTEGHSGREEISSMPGQYRHDIESLLETCDAAVEAGLRSVMLFGIPSEKDALGSGSRDEDGIVQQALRALKDRDFPLYLISDVCLCEYTDHGHCGLVDGETILNDETLPLLTATALSHVAAGADMVAPSDMMDGRVGAIRAGLDAAGYQGTPMMSYAVKYASAWYGPFRDAAQSAPSFGDRRSHQMDPGNRREALREARSDVAEGADVVMIKPALAYLDIVRDVREAVDVPVAAYSVSGEYAMVEAAARQGFIDKDLIVLETLGSMKRAGADLILTYHALDAARLID